jgi:hypothetical protein
MRVYPLFSGRERADATGAVHAEISCSEVFRRVSARERHTEGPAAAAISAAPIPLVQRAARAGRDRGIAHRPAMAPGPLSLRRGRTSRSGFGSWVSIPRRPVLGCVAPRQLPAASAPLTTVGNLPEFGLPQPPGQIVRCVTHERQEHGGARDRICFGAATCIL